jgi:hypothetical protein
VETFGHPDTSSAKRMVFMKTLLWLLVSLLLSMATAEAGIVDIVASGGWSAVIGSSDLIGGAGTNLGDKESAPSATFLTVSATGFNWRVDVMRSDIAWNGNLILYVRRTSDGTGSGIVFGGTSYGLVGTVGASLFSGNGSRANMGVQYKLHSSVLVPPGTYSTTVIYTVVQQ